MFLEKEMQACIGDFSQRGNVGLVVKRKKNFEVQTEDCTNYLLDDI